MIFATDLDRTLIFSKKFVTPEWEGRAVKVDSEVVHPSYMTQKSLALLTKIKKCAIVIPVTARSIKSVQNLTPFQDCSFIICDGGATILYNGEPYKEWNYIMKENMKGCMLELLDYKRELEQQSFCNGDVKIVDDFFILSKFDDQKDCVSYIEEHINKDKFYYSIQNNKFYIIPTFISKKDALSYVIDNVGDNEVMVAGDSDIDFPMYELATIRSFMPVHTEKTVHINEKNVSIYCNWGIQTGEKILSTVYDMIKD